MDLALALSALLLGLAGSPHCAAMCGPSCAALLGGWSSTGSVLTTPALAFHGARVLSYATAGALASAGVAVLAASGNAAPLLRPVWSIVHVSALALGMWLLWSGRQPGWMTRIGGARPAASGSANWQPVSAPRRQPTSSILTAAVAGAAWVAWPCGLLQSALVVAALTNTPQAGALVMVAFALASALGLQFTPWLQTRLAARVGTMRVTTLAVRFAGGMLAAGSAWALGHDVWDKVVSYCT